MLADATAKYNHTGFLGIERKIVQFADILDDVYYEAGIAERMEIYHVAERPIGQSWTEDGDVILTGSRQVESTSPGSIIELCMPSSTPSPHD